MSSTTPPSGGSMPTAPPNPLMTPPPGGWINPSEAPMSQRAVLLVGPVTTFYILGLAAVALRIWARHVKRLSWRLSDYAVFIAVVFGTGYVAICWLGKSQHTISYTASLSGNMILTSSLTG